ncbi:acyl carrier protein [Streptomyces sp. TRM76323]|uniref:Acyl carrier protein n=1 Tax=Streptomyces tamarix TaxID=3078565 RepID=A0ABU3QEL5_9ACTN|nr:acyl carrier protein [Streptomyces tamarix]MDT9681211.1 acyl carrier protein [Streptomyces tamarix]
MSLHESVRQCMSQHFNLPVESITADATLNDLGMDSLAMVELVCVLKEELHLNLSEADVVVSPDSTFDQAVQAVQVAASAGSVPVAQWTAPA